MREIKFRGKRKNNGEWIYGGLILHGGRAWIKDANDKFNLRTISTRYADWRCVEAVPKTIGQFTGLHDKNGKEIYEGDIVKCVSELFSNFGKYPTGKFNTSYYEICEMEDDAYCFGTRRIGKEYISRGILRACAEKFYEVIGNIHDNPDLLKEVSHEA